MSGTRSKLYLIPVTEDLSGAVMISSVNGLQLKLKYILKCVAIGTESRGARESMGDTQYRMLDPTRLIAFKILSKSHWQQFLEGI